MKLGRLAAACIAVALPAAVLGALLLWVAQQGEVAPLSTAVPVSSLVAS